LTYTYAEIKTLTLYSEDTKKELISLSDQATRGRMHLSDLQKQIAELQHGVSVTSLSRPAQNQLQALLGLSSTARDQIVQKHIRKSLGFSEMQDRSNDIQPACKDTYGWFFDADAPEMTTEKLEARDKYSRWLLSESGIFHITGKLGSGKSTLMKYLCGHRGSKDKLLQWAGKLCLVASALYIGLN
jgi:ATPase subunit of ABC transporter with duplicated ATPase domains